jgi:hypothetical protein
MGIGNNSRSHSVRTIYTFIDFPMRVLQFTSATLPEESSFPFPHSPAIISPTALTEESTPYDPDRNVDSRLKDPPGRIRPKFPPELFR